MLSAPVNAPLTCPKNADGASSFESEPQLTSATEGFARTFALVVQVVGDMFLARAVLTKYHHAHIGGGYQPYAVHDFLKGGTFTGEYRHTALSCLTGWSVRSTSPRTAQVVGQGIQLLQVFSCCCIPYRLHFLFSFRYQVFQHDGFIAVRQQGGKIRFPVRVFALLAHLSETSISSDMENGLNRHPAKPFAK